MYRLLQLAALLVVLLVLLGSSVLRAEEDGGLVGQVAPEINGDFALNAGLVKLKNLQGKVVVLDFWAVWCGYCYDTFPHLRDWHTEHKDKGLEVIGLTSYYEQIGFNKQTGRGHRLDVPMNKDEEQIMLQHLVRHHNLDYRVQAASQNQWKRITEAYKIEGYPTVIVIDRKGVVQLVKVGGGQEAAQAISAKIKELLEQK